MLDFVRFIGSLLRVLLNHLYTAHISRLKPLYALLAQRIVKNQTAFIIWPVSVAFILSYPSLYSLHATPETLGYSYLTDLYTIGQEAPPFDSQGIPELVLKQVWLFPTTSPRENYFDVSPGALDKAFLTDVFGVQELLLKDIPLANWSGADGALGNVGGNSGTVLVQSPLQFWNNDLDTLQRDKTPMRTINKRVTSQTSRVGVSHRGLISGAIKVNGIVKSAEAIRIIMMYTKEPQQENTMDYGAVWDNNVAVLMNTTTNINFTLTTDETEPSLQTFLLRLTRMTFIDHFILGLSYASMALYFFISLSNVTSVTSKSGLLLAFVVQMVLSVMAAATLTTYLFQGFDFLEIPFQFLPFVVIVVAIENMFRLLSTISKTPGEMSVSYRISKTLEDCGIISTLVVITDLAILALIYPHVAPNSQLFCIFGGFALIIDHVLHLTYFVAVLSIDVHRLELKDLLDGEDEPKKPAFSWLKLFFVDDLSLDANVDTKESDFKSNFKKLLIAMDKVTLPLSTTGTGSIVALFFFIGTNIRWMGTRLLWPFASSQSLTRLTSTNNVGNFLDKKIFSGEMTSFLNSQRLKSASLFLVSADRPLLANQGSTPSNLKIPEGFSSNTAYRFDIYYILEFLTLLVFILSLSVIALKYFTANLGADDEDRTSKKVFEKEHSFQSKVLSGGHFLDVIKITTSGSHFVVSVGLDHKVLVWSPISQPMPLPTHLPIRSNIWPITSVVLSDHGNYIALFSKTGAIQCWSRLSMTWAWKLDLPELKNTVSLESFFRHKTVPAFLQRKKANQLLLEAQSAPSSRRNSMRSMASPPLSANLAFSNNSHVTDDMEEFVIVLRTGQIITISCQDGTMKKETLCSKPLVSCTKLLTPRVNDRLVSCDEEGVILVSTAVNNKWKTRRITVQTNKFNNPANSNDGETAENPMEPVPHPADFDKSTIAIVPFVGFIVRTTESYAELIDVQTGILIKRFNIRHFKKGSFRVFHDQPTHCRFCGSASIASFSVVYTLAEMKTVVMHTFTVDHKAKTSICLRVERDPREIRCVGFNQVTEHQYELSQVDGWCVTDKNQIMGIKRKSEEQIQESITSAKNSILRRRHRSSQRHFTDDSAPRLHNLWEGWTMSAHGKIEIYDIPDIGNADGLLVNSVGQIARFGHKSIIVAFGNIMKVLYLGNGDLVHQDDEQTASEDISGLTFVNKRRRNLKKHAGPGTSMNFGEVDGIPGMYL